VEHGGKTIEIGQGNNALIFPGVGLGVLVAEAHEVTEGMFTAAARALAGCVGESALESQRLYPRVHRLREVTRRVAEAVVRQAREEGRGRELADSEIEAAVASAMWVPDYPELIPGPS
jgi:malic enzyme